MLCALMFKIAGLWRADFFQSRGAERAGRDGGEGDSARAMQRACGLSRQTHTYCSAINPGEGTRVFSTGNNFSQQTESHCYKKLSGGCFAVLGSEDGWVQGSAPEG